MHYIQTQDITSCCCTTQKQFFWAILDLSFQLRLHRIKLPRVNSKTVPLSDHTAMEQMRKVLWHLVAMVASTKNNHTPIVFVKWDDIKDASHLNLKISPLATVPHKSRLFWAILDLSLQLRLHGIKLPSINSETVPLSDHTAMEQMGKVLWRLVAVVSGTKNNHTPIVFAKWDIKDGFWCLVVSEEYA